MALTEVTGIEVAATELRAAVTLPPALGNARSRELATDAIPRLRNSAMPMTSSSRRWSFSGAATPPSC